MSKKIKFRRLSVDDTLNAGLSIIAVVILIVLLCGSFVMLAFMTVNDKTDEYPENFPCQDGYDDVDWVQVGDGYHDCLDKSDEWTAAVESKLARNETEFSGLSYIMFAIAGIFLLAGILGLGTKIVADGTSAGLALHYGESLVSEDDEPENTVDQTQQMIHHQQEQHQPVQQLPVHHQSIQPQQQMQQHHPMPPQQ